MGGGGGGGGGIVNDTVLIAVGNLLQNPARYSL